MLIQITSWQTYIFEVFLALLGPTDAVQSDVWSSMLPCGLEWSLAHLRKPQVLGCRNHIWMSTEKACDIETGANTWTVNYQIWQVNVFLCKGKRVVCQQENYRLGDQLRLMKDITLGTDKIKPWTHTHGLGKGGVTHGSHYLDGEHERPAEIA